MGWDDFNRETLAMEEVNRRVQKISLIDLLSINGILGSLNYILAPQGVSCKRSMIDESGVYLSTNNLGCTSALELKPCVQNIREKHTVW